MAPFTRLIAPGSLYAINPCSEQIARTIAARLQERPVQAYELRALPSMNAGGINHDDDGGYPGDGYQAD